MVTLRTPKAWPRRTARWFRDRVHAQLVLGISPDAERRTVPSGRRGLGAGRAVGLTTLAVAWVSVWWVPAYLALMVCIFVIPHGHGEPGHASVSHGGSTVGSLVDLGQGLRVDHANEVVGNHLASGSISGPTTSESAIETGVSHPDPASSGIARARRSRSQDTKGSSNSRRRCAWIRCRNLDSSRSR